jgi:hypothetical protein
MVRVIMPATADRTHPVELLLCGHHFRTSRQTLAAAGATVRDMRDDLAGRMSELALL